MLIFISITYLYKFRQFIYFNGFLKLILLFYIIYISFFLNNIKFILIQYYSFLNDIFINLTNGIVSVHPIIFFILYTIAPLIIYLLKIIILNFYIIYYKFYNFKLLTNLIFFKYNLILIFLVIGSIWAQQELNWGGWWNWDFVEYIGFTLYFIILFYLHFKNKLFIYLNSNIILYIIIVIINLVFLRSPIFNSIHSFITISSTNYKPLLIFFIFLFFLTIFFMFFKFYIYYNITNINFFIVNFFIVVFMFYLYSCVEIIFIIFNLFNFIELLKFVVYLSLLPFFFYTIFIFSLILLRWKYFLFLYLSLIELFFFDLFYKLCKNLNNFIWLVYIHFLYLIFFFIIFLFNKSYFFVTYLFNFNFNNYLIWKFTNININLYNVLIYFNKQVFNLNNLLLNYKILANNICINYYFIQNNLCEIIDINYIKLIVIIIFFLIFHFVKKSSIKISLYNYKKNIFLF